MKEVYLYFRTQATLADDDASGDSVMYPLSHLCGMVPSADDTLNIYFKPLIPVQADGQDGAVINNDYVVVTLAAANTHKTVIAALSRLFSGAANGGVHADGFIDVVDDNAGTQAVAGISGLSTISTAAAVA
jgi:hypothetical protein